MCQIPRGSSSSRADGMHQINYAAQRTRTCMRRSLSFLSPSPFSLSNLSSMDTSELRRVHTPPLCPALPPRSERPPPSPSICRRRHRRRLTFPDHPLQRASGVERTLLQNQRPITLQYNPITETIELNENRISSVVSLPRRTAGGKAAALTAPGAQRESHDERRADHAGSARRAAATETERRSTVATRDSRLVTRESRQQDAASAATQL